MKFINREVHVPGKDLCDMSGAQGRTPTSSQVNTEATMSAATANCWYATFSICTGSCGAILTSTEQCNGMPARRSAVRLWLSQPT
jgi:hypothetical protein